MARRISPKHFANLWLERSREGRPHCTENKSFAKKAIDDVCLNADLSETSWDYSYNLCQGMVRLLELGFSTKEMSSHRTLVQKLMRLGRDMMDSGIKEADFFYLGAFVDMKMDVPLICLVSTHLKDIHETVELAIVVSDIFVA